MEQKKTTADQVRPFLAAMDRSIASARRRRLNTDEKPVGESISNETARPANAGPAHGSSNDPTNTIIGQGSSGDPQDPPRFKARPKRPSAFGNGANPSQPNYRTQAG